MAHKITITQLIPGNHLSQFHIFLESDGATADLSDYVIVDPVADLGLTAKARPAIEMITYNFKGFDAKVEFDSGLVDDSMIWVLPQSADNHVCFKAWGGLKDQSGPDGTGKLLLSTNGFSAAGSMGSILIQVRNA